MASYGYRAEDRKEVESPSDILGAAADRPPSANFRQDKRSHFTFDSDGSRGFFESYTSEVEARLSQTPASPFDMISFLFLESMARTIR